MMITKNDWLAAADEYMASEREVLGELPTPEEVVAYANGELDEVTAARVRAGLVYEPALSDLLLDLPDGDTPDNVVPIARPRAVPRWFAVAAMVVLALTALLLLPLRNPDGPEQFVELRPTQHRGAGVARKEIVQSGGRQYHFTALLLADRAYPSYRAVLLRPDRTEVWDSTEVKAEGDGIVSVTVPGRKMKPGSYAMAIYGTGSGEPELLQTYPIQVVSPQ